MTPVRPSRFIWLEDELWRKAAKEHDTVFTVFVVDPVIRLVLPLVLRTGLSPNTITVSSFGLSILSAWLMFTGHLILGGLCFVTWYVADCIDGKVARLTDKCTKFGWWLDAFTDRLGTAIVLLALAVHNLRAGDEAAGVLALALILTWLLGTLNTAFLVDISPDFSVGRASPSSGEPSSETRVRTLKSRLRLGRWVVHDIEFLTLGLAVGPLIGRPTLCLALATVGMALQKTAQTLVFWWRRRAEIATV